MGSSYKQGGLPARTAAEMIEQCQRLIERTKAQPHLSERDRADFIRELEARIRTIRRRAHPTPQ